MLQQNIALYPSCVVLTHNKQTADLLVSIAVTRYLDGGDRYGEAVALITKRNGDVVLTKSFSQSADGPVNPDGFGRDISEQPVTKVWETLCGAPAR